MCYTYDKSKGGDTRELQSRMVPPKKKLGRVTLISMSTLTCLTEKELGREIKSKGDQFRWKKNTKNL